jgi:hypothetical protein
VTGTFLTPRFKSSSNSMLLAAALMLTSCARLPEPAYVPSENCRACHAQIAERYQHVAMARSLYRPTPGNVIEDYQTINHFYHAASGRHYRMIQRDGVFISSATSSTNAAPRPTSWKLKSATSSAAASTRAVICIWPRPES